MIVRYSIAVLAGLYALAAAGAPLAAQPSSGIGAEMLQSAPPAPPPETLASAEPVGVAGPQTPQYRGDGVAAIVNDTVISDFDLRQRVALFVATSGVKPSEKQMKEIREQVLQQLETERLQLLEAQKLNVTVSSGEVDKAIENIGQDNHLPLDQLKTILKRAGVYMATLRAQIATQIAWSKTVQARYSSDVRVSSADVDAEMARLAESANKPRFHVSEIFLAVDRPEDAPKVEKNMEELEDQIRQGAPFPAVARQFSQNPTAAQSGDLGWVIPGQLPPALDKALMKMQAGQVTKPIRAAGGYYILALREREEPEGTKVPKQQPDPQYPPGQLPLARILLPIGPKPPQDLLQRVMQIATVVRSHIQDCTMLPDLVKQMKGAVYMNLGVMHLDELSQQMQTALAKTQPGETTEPFHSPAGVELIVRCDARRPHIATFKMPSRPQIEQSLFQEQMSVMARRYMRDLRRNADIETR